MRNDAMRSIAYGKSLTIKKTAQFTFGVTKLYFVSLYDVNCAVLVLFSLLRSLFRGLAKITHYELRITNYALRIMH